MNHTGKKKWVSPENAARLRDVPVGDVILTLGGELRPRSAWERRSYYALAGVRITVDPDENTYVDTERGEPRGRGAISFLVDFTSRTFAEACEYLRADHEGPDVHLSSSPSGAVREINRGGQKRMPLPIPYRRGWERVHAYLLSRGLSDDLVSAVHDAGLVYADGERAPRIINAVFWCSPHCAFIRGTFDPPPPREPFRRTFGSGDDLAPWVYGDEDAASTCIVESPISGLSLVELKTLGGLDSAAHSNIRILALAGRGLSPGATSVRAAIRGRVVAATDADSVGDELARRILETYPGATRLRPAVAAGTDWNDQLRELRAKPFASFSGLRRF